MREHLLHELAQISRHETRDILLNVEDLLQIREPIPRKSAEVVLDKHQRVNGVLLLVHLLVEVVLIVLVAHKSVMELDGLRDYLKEDVFLSLEFSGEGRKLTVPFEHNLLGILGKRVSAILFICKIHFWEDTQHLGELEIEAASLRNCLD